MNSYYNDDDDVDAGYVKFTDNKIVKTEPISKNIYVDLDKNEKPVGVEVLGMKNDVRQKDVDRKIENSLSDIESDKFKEFAIDEYIVELKNRFGKF
ncbi:DUF2283 domain-containing protein [Candidatus Nitrosocosmicus hydrocola]|uniref:DUF2283 domain-containing protein n=1 Tax=Candidatus Nitrosocosmicus hydrocola TaxID=1826872 RepID=UPI0011E59CC5|nr:DUF2283 domain-containing protein [Candidatus Nitrosocosmicus hydrocola]